MQTTASVMIDRRMEDVFRLTTEHVAEWSDIVEEDYVVEEKNGGGVGTTFHTVTNDRGQRMDFVGIITRHEPPRLHAIEMTGKSFDLEVEYRFDELAGQTQVTQRSAVKGKGLVGLFLLLGGWAMRKSSCRALQKELDNLKAFCERQ